MDLTVTATDNRTLTAGYRCDCGCEPVIGFQRGQATQTKGCCCGSQFAIGTDAIDRVAIPPGCQTQLCEFTAPWGEPLQAVWSINPRTPQETEPHDYGNDR